jgi:hypothetical protein
VNLKDAQSYLLVKYGVITGVELAKRLDYRDPDTIRALILAKPIDPFTTPQSRIATRNNTIEECPDIVSSIILRGSTECLKILLDAGGDKEVALGESAQFGRLEFVDFLLDNYPFNQIYLDKALWSAMSPKMDRAEVMKSLLRKGAVDDTGDAVSHLLSNTKNPPYEDYLLLVEKCGFKQYNNLNAWLLSRDFDIRIVRHILEHYPINWNEMACFGSLQSKWQELILEYLPEDNDRICSDLVQSCLEMLPADEIDSSIMYTGILSLILDKMKDPYSLRDYVKANGERIKLI